jgi:hypothetical protein
MRFLADESCDYIAKVRYVLPRRWVILWAANWVGPGRGQKTTRPGYPQKRNFGETGSCRNAPWWVLCDSATPPP